MDASSVTLKKCEHCGSGFIPSRSTARFCCPAHRVAAYRARRVIPVGARDEYRRERRRSCSMTFDGRIGGSLSAVGLTRPRGYAGLKGWVAEVSFG